MVLQDLAVTKALVFVSGEAFACVLEERKLRVQIAVDEDSLATIDLGRGQKLATGVGVNAQEVSYLVRSAERRYDDTNGCPE